MKKLDAGIILYMSTIVLFWTVSLKVVTLSSYTPGVNPVGLTWNLIMPR